MVEIGNCQVCKKEPGLGVASSGLGPFSLVYGRTCLDEHADAEFAFDVLYEMSEGFEGQTPEHLKDYKTFKDGAYISFQDWLAWRRTQPLRQEEPAYG